MKLDKNQRKPRIFKAFDLVLIITRESIRRTIPVAFISLSSRGFVVALTSFIIRRLLFPMQGMAEV